MKDEKGMDIDAWHRSSMPVGTPVYHYTTITLYDPVNPVFIAKSLEPSVSEWVSEYPVPRDTFV